jgi:acetylornithine deacetylase/succinyl-diaminopimelate desuccinylase-like protein
LLFQSGYTDFLMLWTRPLAGAVLAAFLMTPAAGTAAPRASAEHTSQFRRYLQADTTNPPGNEAAGAAVLAQALAAEKIPFRLLVHPSGRASLYARLEPAAPGAPDLVLLHHIDVVPAGDGWTHPPFGAEVHEGRLYGRGADAW